MAACALVSGLGLCPTGAQAGDAGELVGAIAVGPASADAGVEAVAEGLASWLRNRLRVAGVKAAPRGATAGLSREALLDHAGAAGVAGVVFPDVRLDAGSLEIHLVLHEAATGRIVAAPGAQSPLAEAGRAVGEAGEALLAVLGVAGGSGGAVPPPLLDELVASGLALRLLDAGELARAWREVDRKLSPTAVRARETLLHEARFGDAPAAERARLLAAAEQLDEAQRLVDPLLAPGTRGASAGPPAQLAAAEIQLARRNPRGARRLLEEALQAEPGDRLAAEIHRGLAAVLTLQRKPDAARRALERAEALDPGDPRTREDLAQLAPGASERAVWLLRAGRSEAERLDAPRAESLLQRASEVAPEVGGEAWRTRAELESRLGRPAESLSAWKAAAKAGADRATTLRGMGRSQRALGNKAAAERTLAEAVELAPDDPDAARELGELYAEGGRAGEAVPLLERAVRLAPESADSRRALARSLHATGRNDEAVALLTGAGDEPESLVALAALQREAGHLDEAEATLESVLDRTPYAAYAHAERARILEARGDPGAARIARDLSALLAGERDGSVAPGAALASETTDGHGPDFDALAGSFAERSGRARTAVFLGLRDAPSWRGLLYRWLHPRRPAHERIEEGLARALAGHFEVRSLGAPPPRVVADTVDRLYDFESKRSLAAEDIVAVNRSLGSDAVFVGRIERAPGEPQAARGADCNAPERFEVEVRMLAGQHPDLISILANAQCIPDATATWGAWNARAFAVYAVLFLFLLYPVVRGWGSVTVQIVLPPRTRGFFSIRLSTNPSDMPSEPKKKGSRGGALRSLRSLSRFERQMAGRETVFRWIPAVKRPYHVTVKGPLFDAKGDEIIGHFLETKTTRVQRRSRTTLVYDFRPKECAVEVQILWSGEPVRGARFALRGDGALRYAREGKAILPLGLGHHRLLFGHEGRVAEVAFEIESLESAIPLWVDLADERGLLFRDCPDAVDPYLQGDYGAAADALAAAGHAQEERLARAEYFQAIGEKGHAAEALAAAGRFDEAAELRAETSDLEGSAALFEKAGEYARAADAYRIAGDLAAAARCYEAAYDFENALECYRETGDVEKQGDILEKTGAYLEAAELARRLGDTDRAIRNLQFIGRNERHYGDSCRLFAEVLAERGEWDVAAEKLAGAIAEAGGEHAPAALHERHAQLLEKAGQTQAAVDAYRTLRRLDPQREDVAERITALQREIETCRPAPAADSTAPVASRYEILGELGRGAMGLVYRARDKHLGRIVALKRLPENLRDHPTAIALFQREAQAAAALNHRNIVTLYDAGEENGSYFITMELLEGMPLNAILRKRGKLGAKDVVRLGVQVAAGLHYAHEKRIVHRDIKTGNLFFTRDRTVKIMDFGLAKTLEEVQRSSTVIGGTPYFMAPEQAEGGDLDHRADLYAFGVTLFQLVTGTVPFRDGDLAYHHRHTPPPDPHEIEPAVPRSLADLILALLAKVPDERPGSAAEVGRRLQSLLGGMS